MSEIYCQKCGGELNPDANFCGICGIKLTNKIKRANDLFFQENVEEMLFISAGNEYTTYKTRWKEMPKSLKELGAKIIRMRLPNGFIVDAIWLPDSDTITEEKISKIRMPRRNIFRRFSDWESSLGCRHKRWTWNYSFKGTITLVSWKHSKYGLRKFSWEINHNRFGIPVGSLGGLQ